MKRQFLFLLFFSFFISCNAMHLWQPDFTPLEQLKDFFWSKKGMALFVASQIAARCWSNNETLLLFYDVANTGALLLLVPIFTKKTGKELVKVMLPKDLPHEFTVKTNHTFFRMHQ